MGGALPGAHAAIDAQVGNFADIVRREQPRVDVLLEEVPDQVRLGARRGRLAMRYPEHGAHALLGGFRSAVATAITLDAFTAHFARLPAQTPGRWLRMRDRITAQRPGRHARIGTNDFPRVQYPQWIENRLQLAENGIELPVLPLHPRR